VTEDKRDLLRSDLRIDYSGEYPHRAGETFTERMRASSKRVIFGILLLLTIYLIILALGVLPGDSHGAAEATHAPAHEAPDHVYIPPLLAVLPFVALLLSIAILPLLKSTQHWWHHNKNRFLVAATLGFVTLAYYGILHPGGLSNHFTHLSGTSAGLETLWAAFSNGVFAEYIPFIVLLFALYVISGGVNLKGDLPAHPTTNLAFIAIGTLLASFIGTTGAAMVLIRPLLETNAERKFKTHTVVFFIFAVCNCGGLLLPIGDPPLFLGYLRGVPFTWTLDLWPYWLGVNAAILIIFYIWDHIAYRKEELRDLIRDEKEIRPIKLSGKVNFLLLIGVVFSVALVVPGKDFFGTGFHPPVFLREAIMLALVVLSLIVTRASVRVANRFDYVAITEVAALFIGIFICMQVPIEILNATGPGLGIDTPLKFFWATGILSSFLDNAPTYVVFFETAISLPVLDGAATVVLSEGREILEHLLVPISLGAVFMGANTYIGNGPNFMVKSIAEQSGVKMPSFFGYMLYSGAILIPIFIGLTLIMD